MQKPRVSTSTLVFLLGGLGFTAMSAMGGAGPASAIPVISGLLAWLAGVAGNRVADVMGQDLDTAEPPAEEIFRNHHIAELVGHGIASVAHAHVLNQPQFHTCRDEIEAVARQAPAAWLKFIRTTPPGFEPLSEIDLPVVLANFATQNGQVPLLTPEDWQEFLHSFTDLPGGGCCLTPEALKVFADALHLHLAESLWNWVKHDFSSGDGKAYVATEMLYLSRILQAVEDLRKQSPALTAPGVDAAKFQSLFDAGTRRQADLIQRLDEKQTQFFRKLFAQNGELKDLLLKQEVHLQRLSDDVANKVVAALKQELAAKGLKPADLSQEELERELASRLPNLKPEDLHRLIGYARFKEDITRIFKYAPAELIGRDDEKKLLSDAWEKVVREEKARPRVLTFVALGGEGKTSLVAKWAAELAHQDWPGCDAAFAWSFYSQGTREQLAASSDLFLKEALNFFGDDADRQFAASNAGAFEKGQRLARIVGQRRRLLILDGLEPLQYAPTSPTPGQLKDQGIAALLKGLAAASHGLCVVTTRYSLPDLKAFWQTTAPEVKLLRLSREAGVHLLKTLGVNGTAQEFATLVEDVKGHALTLTLLSGFLQRAFHGDIRQRDRVKFEKADEKMDGGHAFRTMTAYEQWLLRDGGDEGRREVAVLRLMGLFDRPADAGCLAALRRETIPGLTEPLTGLADDDWEFCLSGLEAAKLLTVNRDATGALASLDAHPHLRAYFAKQLSEKNPEAWRAGHKRLYEHLCASTPDKPQPTLEDLQPLYQAVAHGCQAGLQQEACDKVYYSRIVRGDENYSARKLGAVGSDLGAEACFFEQPWSRVSPALTEADQAWMLNEAAYRLRALGRLAESLQPMRAGLEIEIKNERWERAAVCASNLSELELTLGEVAGAVGNAEQSVTYADRSRDAFDMLDHRTVHADALHQAGRRTEAATLFEKAEQMQTERQPAYPLMYSMAGFRYCDLLLAAPERAAWQIILGRAELPLGPDIGAAQQRLPTEEIEFCRAVSKRAAQTLKWAAQNKAALLTIALEHLTLGRAALYAAILEGGASVPPSQFVSSLAPPALETARRKLDAAVDGLRRAGTQDHLPSGLFTRAWLRFLTGARTGPESAPSDLDEAWEIAERGPMKLFLADIHLHRARLFFREKSYPWKSPQDDLAAAEKLINTCGYHRRDQELADAKKAILGLSRPT